ncbi:MAG TPA: galactose oxidase-like domain-containing protein, partial [Candidatus Bathyarchaeia archaeon]|nr:galactose oxidase-like domain-containing protein [Candidatus Bathyarchaeia archaeon]
MSATILPNGKVLATGGSLNDEDTTTASLNADLYDPATNTFSSAGANSYARLYHSVSLLLPDGTVWLAGGNPQRGTYEQNMEIYQPAYLFTTDSVGNVIFANRPSISSSPSAISYGNQFTVQTPSAANIASVALIRNGAATHAFDMDQRFVGLSFTVGSGALTITAPPNGNIAPPGYYMLFLVDSSGVPSVASIVQLAAQSDFSVSATPSSQTVTQGNGTSYTVNVAPSGGFAGTVGLSVSGLPQGATATFNPTSITTSGSSTLSVSTLSSTPPGSYPLTITATSGALTHTATVTLVVNGAGSFTLSVAPTSQTVSRGSSTQYAVTISAQGGFSGTVNLSLSGLPPRTTSSFNPSSVVGSGSSTLKVTANKPARIGTYTFTIKGTSGSVVQSANVTLIIN